MRIATVLRRDTERRFVPALGRSILMPRLIAAGECAGAVTLFRYDIGVAAFGSGCAVLAFRGCFPPVGDVASSRTIIRLLIPFAAGFAAVMVPVAAALGFSGVIPDRIFDVVTMTTKAYAKTHALPFPGPRMLWWHPVDSFVYLPLVTCAAVLPALIAFARRERSQARKRGECSASIGSRDRIAIHPVRSGYPDSRVLRERMDTCVPDSYGNGSDHVGGAGESVGADPTRPRPLLP